jgi:lysyl-tRNA synthetase class 2
MSETQLQQDRLAKLQKLRELGVDPYGGRFTDVVPLAEARERFEQLDLPQGEKSEWSVRVAGRVLLYRDIGKLIFMTIQDGGGRMQVALSKRELDEQAWSVGKLLDLGDIVGVEGPMGVTRTGELTVWAASLTLLCKSLTPPPEKFHGLTDVEARYRQRYVDLFANPEVAETFRKRSAIISQVRRYLIERGFLEVETPMMQPIYGGAAARPFVTHHNTLDLDLYLRISPELYLKRLLVGGMERVFEINRNFRNEGISTRHNPEFTMLEAYQAYGDYHDMMELTEGMISAAAEDILNRKLEELRRDEPGDLIPFAVQLAAVDDSQASSDEADQEEARLLGARARERWDLGELWEQELASIREGRVKLPFGGEFIDYTPPWRRARYADLLAEHDGDDMKDIDAVKAKAAELHIDTAGKDDAVVVNELFEQAVEPHLVQPTFVLDYPAALCPLTRRHPDDPSLALRFEAYVANMEIANAYSELNDPAVQEENLAGQLQGEEDETMRVMDADFVDALRYGMPPAGGLGVGIDRVVMLLTDSASIRDVILFPQMRLIGD